MPKIGTQATAVSKMLEQVGRRLHLGEGRFCCIDKYPSYLYDICLLTPINLQRPLCPWEHN